MTNTINYTAGSYTEKCTHCHEIDCMNDGSFPFEDCTHDNREVTNYVDAQVIVNGLDYGTKRFYGADAQAAAEAYAAPILAALAA